MEARIRGQSSGVEDILLLYENAPNSTYVAVWLLTLIDSKVSNICTEERSISSESRDPESGKHFACGYVCFSTLFKIW